MKKTIIIITIIIAALTVAIAFVSTTEPTTTEETEPTIRTAYGRYYPHGQIITDDSHEWEYKTDLISDRTPTYGMPVCVWFDTKGTSEIFDDEIIDLTYNSDLAN